MPEPSQSLSGKPGTDAGIGGEQPLHLVELGQSSQAADGTLISRVELLQVAVELAGQPRAFSQQIPPISHKGPQILDLASRPDGRQVFIAENDSSDDQGVDRVSLRMVALVAPRSRCQLRRNLNDGEGSGL